MSRIAHLTTVHHVADPRIFRKQLATLAEAGFEAHLVASHARSEERRGIRITALPQVEGRYQRLQLHPKLYRLARRLAADLYHFHDPELIPVAYALKRGTGARVVYDMHENYRYHGPFEGRLLRALERWCFRWVDHVVVANAAQEGIPAASGAPSTTIANYYRPPASGATPPAKQRPPEALRAVYTGVMGIERGLLTLVDLAARFEQERPRWRLDLTGVCYRSSERRRAEERIRAHGLSEALERTGWDAYVPWPRIDACHRRAHVGLLPWRPSPARRDVVPTKFYEYLSAGLPVLCSDFPRWQRLVDRHACGATVPAGDAEAAFSVLEKWVADPARYRALSKNARAAASQYQWPVMGRRLVRLYNRLLGTDRPLPPVPEEAAASFTE